MAADAAEVNMCEPHHLLCHIAPTITLTQLWLQRLLTS